MNNSKNILLLLIFTCSTLWGQAENLDSLWQVWKNEKQEDEVRLNAVNDVFWERYLFNNPDTVLVLIEEAITFAQTTGKQYWEAKLLNTKARALFDKNNYLEADKVLQQALELSAGLKNREIVVETHNSLGSLNYSQGNFNKAINYYHQALKINIELKNDLATVTAYNNIGTSHYELGNYPEALEYTQKGLKILERMSLTNTRHGGVIYNNIGEVYYEVNNFTKANKYFQQALRIMRESKNKQGTAVVYNNLGNLYFKQHKYKDALIYTKQALRLNEELGVKKGIAETCRNLGNMYYEEQSFEEALIYYQRSLKLSEEIADKRGTAISYYNFGRLAIINGKVDDAFKWCKQGLELTREIKALPEEKDCLKCLYTAYKKKGEIAHSLNYYEQYLILKDSLFNKEKTQKITQLEMRYDYEKETAELEQKQKQLLLETEVKAERSRFLSSVFLGGLSTIFLLGFFLLSRANNRKLNKKNIELGNSKKVIEEQLLLLKNKNEELEQYIESNTQLEQFAQIASHDLKSPLRRIQSFSEMLNRELKVNASESVNEALGFIKTNTEKMQNLIDDIMDYSQISSNTEKELVELDRIIEDLGQNLKQKYGDKLEFYYGAIPIVFGNPSQLQRLFQNLIENGIKYNQSSPIKIGISVTETQDFYEFKVSDNGIGIEAEYHKSIFDMFRRLHSHSEYKGTGIGLATCKRIIDLHNGEIWVTSPKKQGSVFHFTLPKKINYKKHKEL